MNELINAYTDKLNLVGIKYLAQDEDVVIYSSVDKILIFNTSNMQTKTTKNTQGVAVMTLKKKAVLQDVAPLETSGIVNHSRYRTKTIPSAGALLKPEDTGEKQDSFEI